MNTEEDPVEPERCVIVVNESLPPGKAANAAAVVAFTLGQRHGQLVGAQLVDGDNGVHAGLIPIGIPVLRATAQQLAELRVRSAGHCDMVDFPVQGQQTTDYEAFRTAVRAVHANELQYLAVALVGPKKRVGKLVGGLTLYA